MESKELGNGIVMLQFEDAAQPVFVEKKGKPYIYYGEKNDYPQYLLYLYNNSAKHSAIINGKVDYVCGKGWVAEDETNSLAQTFIKQANAKGESLNEVTDKVALDLEIFNGAYLQVVWNRIGGIASVYHVDYSSVRSNVDNSRFFVADDWVIYNPDGTYKMNNRVEPKEFAAFNPSARKGTQILYVKKYHPGIDIYTLPTYRGSITWIEVDIEIGNYHLNNVKGGFFANKLINFNNGKPTPEEQEKIEKLFDKKFGGVRGRKYMLAFNADSSKATSVVDLSISESDKLFDQLNKTTQQEIFTGHRITSPMLFGIKTEGQLGGRTEIREASELFQNTYVNGRQQWLEKVFNMLARYKGVDTPLTIQRTEPIAFEFSEAVLSEIMTKDEIREKVGLAPLVPPAQPSVSSTSQFSAQEDARDVEVFASYGVSRSSVKVVRSKKVMFTSDEDEQLHFAAEADDLSKLQAKVLDLLIKDPRATPEVIAKALVVKVSDVRTAITALEDMELIKPKEVTWQDETVIERKPVKDAAKIISEQQPETRSIEVLYSYEGPKDDKNRPFCAKMLELDRLYSRKEIEQISNRLGYSVWTRRGGWYTIPGTNEHRPYCRHSWMSNVVVKKRR